MFNPSLPHLLEGASEVPTLLLWGRQDAVVPVSAAEVYHRALRDSRLAVFDGCGHRPEIEKPGEFIKEVEAFLA
jgi:pimeloyl-ACP methyl ester carboxylesterase